MRRGADLLVGLGSRMRPRRCAVNLAPAEAERDRAADHDAGDGVGERLAWVAAEERGDDEAADGAHDRERREEE